MNLCSKYGYEPSVAEIDSAIGMISQNVDEFLTEEVLMTCFSCMDLTSLHDDDTPEKITKFVGKLNALAEEYPDYPMPASVCVFSNLVPQVCAARPSAEVHATVVSGCFPSAQSFIDVKTLECRKAVEAGADEVDVVLPLSSFAAGDYETAGFELRAMRAAIDEAAAGRKVIYKVILETGLLKDPALIAEASFLAMECGADFIKTSTGKVSVNATPMAAFIMCQCIKKFYEATGRKVGFKPAGGMTTAQDAAVYYTIVSYVLGPEWLSKQYFRLGVSRMAGNLMSYIEKETVSIF